MKDQFQIHSKSEGTLLQAHLLCLYCSRDTNWVVEVVVVHFVQFYLSTLFKGQASNAFKSIWISRCFTLLVFYNAYTRLKSLNNLWSLKSCIFWWTTTSGEMLLMNLLLMTSSLQEHFVFRSTLTSGAVFSDALSFLFVVSKENCSWSQSAPEVMTSLEASSSEASHQKLNITRSWSLSKDERLKASKVVQWI